MIPSTSRGAILPLSGSTRQRQTDMQQAQMTRAAFTIAAIALVCGTGAAAPPVMFEHHDNHGKGRRSVKNDLSMLPPDVSAIQTVTPFRGVLFRDAFSGTLFLGEEDSDPWFRDARGVARCVPHVGSLLIKRSEFFILRSSHNHINQEE